MPPRKSVARKRGTLREYTHPAPTKDGIDSKKYGGKWVAIWKRRVIDADRDLEALCDRLERIGLDEKAMLMKVPPPGIWIV